jgi:hypothetical protein
MLQIGRWPLDHPERSKHRWDTPPMNPPKPPLKVVTKPHTERSDNTYLEGWALRHTTGQRSRRLGRHAERFPLVSGLRDCFQPAKPHTHAGYVPASIVLRLSPTVWPCVWGCCLAGGCVGAAKTPPFWAGSVGRCSGVGVWLVSWFVVCRSSLARGLFRRGCRWCR